jgi:hypothetical protein
MRSTSVFGPGQSYKVKLTALGTYQYSDSAATQPKHRLSWTEGRRLSATCFEMGAQPPKQGGAITGQKTKFFCPVIIMEWVLPHDLSLQQYRQTTQAVDVGLSERAVWMLISWVLPLCSLKFTLSGICGTTFLKNCPISDFRRVHDTAHEPTQASVVAVIKQAAVVEIAGDAK